MCRMCGQVLTLWLNRNSNITMNSGTHCQCKMIIFFLEFTHFIHSFHWHLQMGRFLAILRGFFHSSLLYTLSIHPFPPTSLPSSLTLSCHLFLGLPLSLVSKFIYNTFLGIIFSSILCTCPNQHNLFNLI